MAPNARPRALLNHQFRLAARPVGMVKRSDFNYVKEAVREPKEGESLVRMIYISLDPAMRGWMNEERSYVPGVTIGEVMRALALGKVVESKNPAFAAGDCVYGPFGVQEYAITNGQGITKVDPKIAPLPVYLGALGMPGMTAYFALLETGELRAGDVVVMSAAAGAVGSVAGQIAKIKGCPVETLQKLYKGENLGKLILKVGEE
jgi:NADPH-dependent curcumin reductase CurA